MARIVCHIGLRLCDLDPSTGKRRGPENGHTPRSCVVCTSREKLERKSYLCCNRNYEGGFFVPPRLCSDATDTDRINAGYNHIPGHEIVSRDSEVTSTAFVQTEICAH